MLTLRFAKSQKRFGNTYRLVLVVAPPGGGKTRVLHELHERIAAPLLDVNLELSRRMLDHNERQRALQMPRLFANILAECPDELVLLDNTESLFDASAGTFVLCRFLVSCAKTVCPARQYFVFRQ